MLQLKTKIIVFNLPALASCCVFVGFLILRAVLESDNTFELLFNSSSGPIFFLLFGILLNLLIRATLVRSKQSQKISSIHFIYPVIFIFFTLMSFIGVSKESQFIISNGGDYYQRVGDYCFILVVLYNLYSLLWIRLNGSKYLFVKRLNVLFSVLCVILCVFAGSNKAPIAILGLLLIFLLTLEARVVDNNFFIDVEGKCKLGLKRLFVNSTNALFLIIVFIIIDINTLKIFNGARILNSGETGLLDSIASRVNIFENLVEQLSSAPFFGQMNFDLIYIHSVPFMVLTHLGILGFVFYIINFILWVRYAKSNRGIFATSGALSQYAYLLFLWIALLGLLTSGLFFSLWWFSIGLLSPMMAYKSQYKNI
jgi:hypothetical protein